MSSSEVPEALVALLRDHLPRVDENQSIDPTMELVDVGGLDSLGMVGLIVAVEDEFDVEVPDERLGAEMFATPASLWASIRDLLQPYPAP